MIVVGIALLPDSAVTAVRGAATKEERIAEAEKHMVFFRAGIREHIVVIEGTDVHGALDGRHVAPELEHQIRRALKRLSDHSMLMAGAIAASSIGVLRIYSRTEFTGPV